MRDFRVGAILVTEGDRRLLGIFTGRDAVHRVLAEGKSAGRTILADVMTREPHTMPPGKTAIEALRRMEDGRCRHLPRTASWWGSFRVSTSVASNWIASTRRPGCGSGLTAEARPLSEETSVPLGRTGLARWIVQGNNRPPGTPR